MEMELGLEKGDIQPLKEMVNEASVLVHRSVYISQWSTCGHFKSYFFSRSALRSTTVQYDV